MNLESVTPYSVLINLAEGSNSRTDWTDSTHFNHSLSVKSEYYEVMW